MVRNLVLTLAALVCGATLLAAEPTPKEQSASLWRDANAARREKRFDEARALQEKIRALPERTPEALSASFAFDAEAFVEEGGEGAAEKAMAAYEKAFAVPGLPRERLDAARSGAMKKLARGKLPDAAVKVAGLIVDDPASGAVPPVRRVLTISA